MTERLKDSNVIHYEDPVDEAYFRIIKTMVEYRMGKERAKEAISQQIRGMSIIREEARPFLAVKLLYTPVWTTLDIVEKRRREEAEELLGKALQQSREQVNLTVQEVAQLAGLRPSKIMALEEGDIVLPDLSAVLGIEEIRKTLPDKLESLIKGKGAPAN